MLILMQRDPYKTVTVPILVRCAPDASEGTATSLPGFAGLHPVRPLRDEDLDRHTAIGLRNWKALSETERKRFCGVVTFMQAAQSGDEVAARRASEELDSLRKGEVRSLERILKQPFASFGRLPFSETSLSLSRVISSEIDSIAFVLWRRSNEIVPALYCPTLLSAFYLRALLRSASAESLRICPKCGEPFLQTRPNQDYCSLRCREAHRVARWRARAAVSRASSKKTKQKSKTSGRQRQ
jgi:hypothetical protein